jgi:hypothetical protein
MQERRWHYTYCTRLNTRKRENDGIDNGVHGGVVWSGAATSLWIGV